MKKTKNNIFISQFITICLVIGLSVLVNSSGQTSEESDGEHLMSGYWSGAILLPGTELEINVDLAHKEDWKGTIDIPVQQLRGFKLGDIVVEEEKISFSMPNIPGDPKFSGKLANGVITGDFTQSGQNFKFRLAKAEKKIKQGETPSKGVPGDGLDGIWQGSLRVNAFELRLLFKLNKNDKDFKGTMSSIDQNANDIPVSKATENGREILIEVQSIGGIFEGKLSADGSEIEGQWKQGGQKFPLKILRLERAPDLARPQEPKKPYPYTEEEVVFRNPRASIKLAGTLTYPKTKGPHPVAVLISGSGAQDRDESVMGHKPFLVLADHLTRQGIAVLRFDDRGTAESEGDFSKALVKDFADDVLSAVEFLKTRPELNPKQIGLIGHSEGGIVAPMVAVESKDVAFIVMLAGVGVPMSELLPKQSADLMRVMGATDEIIEQQMEIQSKIFEIALGEEDVSKIQDRIRSMLNNSLAEFSADELKTMGISDSHIETQVRTVTSPWFRDLITIDPAPTLEKVQVPVLAINGKKDLQVACDENLDAIKEALTKGGNKQFKVQAFDDLNHLFQKCKTGAITEYGTIEETFNANALKTVSSWINNIYNAE